MATGLIALVIVFSTALTTVMSVQTRRIAAERDRANQETAVAQEVSNFLVRLFSISDPREARGRSITAKEILDRGASQIGSQAWGNSAVQARLLSVMGEVYSSLGLRDEALPLLEQAYRTSSTALGPEDPATLRARFKLAKGYFAKGDYDRATQLLRTTYEEQMRILGPDNRDTALTLRALARLLRNTGHMEEAQPLYQQSLAILQKTLGPEDLETLDTMNQLGILYWSRGLFAKAQPLLEESLRIATAKLGVDHPTRLSYLENMAVFQATADHWHDPRPHREEAERLYEECIAAQRRVLGSEHPETLRTLNNLGSFLLDEGRYAAAKAPLLEAVRGRTHVLGPRHRATLLSQYNLACVWRGLGQRARAESLLVATLAMQRKVIGRYHREVRLSLDELYQLRLEAGERKQAKAIFPELLEILKHDAEREDASADELNRYAWALVSCKFEEFRDPEKGLRFALKAVEASQHRSPEDLRTLARAYHLTGQTDLARATIKEALAHLAPDADARKYQQDLALY